MATIKSHRQGRTVGTVRLQMESGPILAASPVVGFSCDLDDLKTPRRVRHEPDGAVWYDLQLGIFPAPSDLRLHCKIISAGAHFKNGRTDLSVVVGEPLTSIGECSFFYARQPTTRINGVIEGGIEGGMLWIYLCMDPGVEDDQLTTEIIQDTSISVNGFKKKWSDVVFSAISPGIVVKKSIASLVL